jgi:hypothetical protein
MHTVASLCFSLGLFPLGSGGPRILCILARHARAFVGPRRMGTLCLLLVHISLTTESSQVELRHIFYQDSFQSRAL